jgi:hypothetical protein
MFRHLISLVMLLTLLNCGLIPNAFGVAKVFLMDGQTRLGFINVRDGRVTVRGEDRLFQHSERAVHRIEHVTGETTLIGKDNVLLRETPEVYSKNLVAIPKGCEVIVLESTGDWVKIEVYAGETRSLGFVAKDDLSDVVFFNPVSPDVRFKDPPPTRKERYGRMKDSDVSQVKFEDLLRMQNETDTDSSILSFPGLPIPPSNVVPRVNETPFEAVIQAATGVLESMTTP